jgi:hypothetical protein
MNFNVDMASIAELKVSARWTSHNVEIALCYEATDAEQR